MASDFVLLVKLKNKDKEHSYKLAFGKRPSVADVAKEVAKQANLSPELEVLLFGSDPDFPGEACVLGPTAQLANKQVLTADTQIKETHTWEDVDCPERGKAVLKEHGITPETAGCLVHVLGYTDPEDLQHVTPALLEKLPLKPLEKARFQKLVDEAQKGNVAGVSGQARPPSARFAKKSVDAKPAAAATAADKGKATTTGSVTAKPAGSTTAAAKAGDKAAPPAAASKDAAAKKPAAPSSAGTTKPGSGLGSGNKAGSSKPTPLGSRNPSSGGNDPGAAAAEASPAAKPPPPPEDEDEDDMLKRILAEGEAEKKQVDTVFQGQFQLPLKKAEVMATLEGHTESVLALVLSPDDSTLYTASGDNTIKVWNVSALTLKQTLTEHSASVGVLCMSTSGDLMFSASGDGCVIAWCTLGGNAKVQFRKDDAHDYGILAMTLSNSGLMLLTASADKKIRGWEVDLTENSLTLAMEMSGHLEPVRCLALSPDDSFLFSGSEDATIKMWQADPAVGYKFVRALRGHEATVYGLAMSQDGSMLVSCSADKTITVWKLTTGSGKRGAGKDLLPDGPSIKQVLMGHKGDINCVVLSPDARTLYSSGDDKTVRIWGLLAQKAESKNKETQYALQHTLEGHALIVYRVAVSSKGNRVYSGSADNTAKVWSIDATAAAKAES